jgi:hypothetical protein
LSILTTCSDTADRSNTVFYSICDQITRMLDSITLQSSPTNQLLAALRTFMDLVDPSQLIRTAFGVLEIMDIQMIPAGCGPSNCVHSGSARSRFLPMVYTVDKTFVAMDSSAHTDSRNHQELLSPQWSNASLRSANSEVIRAPQP